MADKSGCSKGGEHNLTAINEGNEWHIECTKCGAEGPTRKTAREAEEAWDRMGISREYKLR